MVRCILLVLELVYWTSVSWAEDLTISMAEIPNLTYYDKDYSLAGDFPKLLSLLDEYYEDGALILNAYPFARSINNVVAGLADAHVPLIKADTKANLNFRHVDETLLDVTFVIYSHRDNPVSKYDDFTKLTVDTVIGHKQFFEFPVQEVIDFETGLKKVTNKRSDAFIMEQDAVDALIRSHSYNSIHRAHFQTWPSTLIVSKSPRGELVNKLLGRAIINMKSDPRYPTLARRIHTPFEDWQPYAK